MAACERLKIQEVLVLETFNASTKLYWLKMLGKQFLIQVLLVTKCLKLSTIPTLTFFFFPKKCLGPLVEYPVVGQGIAHERVGLGWRVGNGRMIQIWKDKWIPSAGWFKPFINKEEEWSDHMLSQLLDSLNSTWKTNPVEQIFHPVDVTRITNIAIQQCHLDDQRIRFPTRNRVFSFQSSYHYVYKI